MRRFSIFVLLLSLALPAGVTLTGCTSNPNGDYCNGTGHGAKVTDLETLTLSPATTGISLAWGQTQQAQSPSGKSCTGDAVSVSSYVYAVTNNSLLDISPAGNLCAGTWNRNSSGDVTAYTICTPPTNTSSYGTTYLTATSLGVTSNAVPIYVHPSVTSVSMLSSDYLSCLTKNPASSCSLQTQCYSQGTQTSFSPVAYMAGTTTPLCGPQGYTGIGTSTPACSTVLGTMNYALSNSTVGTIDQYGNITANLPGTTSITTTVSQGNSVAGYFSTCPPASIQVATNDGLSSGTHTVTQGTPLGITTTVTDTKGATITGLSLEYEATNQTSFSVSSSSGISASYPGNSAIFALCQPTNCNPAPTNMIGQFGTGLPIVSNSTLVTSPGVSSNYLVMGSFSSQYLVPVDLSIGNVGSSMKLPYVPNSMVSDPSGLLLYLGSDRELMGVSASTMSITKEDISAPGHVLAISPDGTKLLISNDTTNTYETKALDLLYVYNTASGITASISGVGKKAAFTPDGNTVYVMGTDASCNGITTPCTPKPELFIYSSYNGWTTYDLSTVGGHSDLTLTVPSVGVYIAGTDTTAHGYCSSVTTANPPTVIANYPAADLKAYNSDQIAATQDGQHILSISDAANTLSDLTVAIPTGACPTSGLSFTSTPLGNVSLGITPAGYNKLIASPATNDITFVTYTSNSTSGGAKLPYYLPSSTTTLGTVGSVTLSGSATAPVSGIFSPDQTIFFVGTSGDNLVHFINTATPTSAATLTDIKTINPGLTNTNGQPVEVDFMAVRPRALN